MEFLNRSLIYFKALTFAMYKLSLAIAVLDFILPPVFYLKHDVSEAGFCLNLKHDVSEAGFCLNFQVEPGWTGDGG
jgi:hypothetical protein